MVRPKGSEDGEVATRGPETVLRWTPVVASSHMILPAATLLGLRRLPRRLSSLRVGVVDIAVLVR